MKQLPQLPPSDEELVRMTLENKSYFGDLVDRYQAKLTRYIARLGVLNNDDQLDVLQDIFLKTYKNLNGFDTSLQFSSWIYRIAHNEAVSWYRRKNVRPEGHLIADSEEIISFLSAKTESADEVFDKTVNANLVNDALQKIDDRYREVIILRFFEHKEYEEISDILKIPVGSVGTLLHRGKKQLATVLNPKTIRI
ncbi:sigma-70 family RNA polymerase sigma factor [Candidatus Kaiserbacteria bacterium]|nr:sigma-70 family RNA polymerase sigma factor [Candidatus Kaiserbacteria bacterium]USN92179.1 MAG: sigma-70 family RNA polymerase sigma factor [Candidatus Nomurabacteria bacterium]